jgi:hypothetical protein
MILGLVLGTVIVLVSGLAIRIYRKNKRAKNNDFIYPIF